MIGKYPKKRILEFILLALLFALISACTVLKTVDFNVKLIFMILLVFLTYYMVIRFRKPGTIYVLFMSLSGFISILSVTNFNEYHFNAVLAFQIAIVISILYLYIYVAKVEASRSELYQHSIIDDVTEIYNKRYFNLKVIEEYERAKRQNQRFSVLMMDLNKFKSINDTHGHLFGDEILKYFANEVKNKVRTGDAFCRFGGDEFVMLISNYSEESFQLIGKRIEESIDHINSKYHDELKGSFSVSVGLAVYPDDTTSLDDILYCADMAMYEAKLTDKTSFKKYSNLESIS